jgi:hypothetical protein
MFIDASSSAQVDPHARKEHPPTITNHPIAPTAPIVPTAPIAPIEPIGGRRWRIKDKRGKRSYVLPTSRCPLRGHCHQSQGTRCIPHAAPGTLQGSGKPDTDIVLPSAPTKLPARPTAHGPPPGRPVALAPSFARVSRKPAPPSPSCRAPPMESAASRSTERGWGGLRKRVGMRSGPAPSAEEPPPRNALPSPSACSSVSDFGSPIGKGRGAPPRGPVGERRPPELWTVTGHRAVPYSAGESSAV